MRVKKVKTSLMGFKRIGKVQHSTIHRMLWTKGSEMTIKRNLVN